MFGNKKSKKETEILVGSSTIIALGAVITGNLDTPGNVRIDGKLKGDIKCQSKFVLGQDGVVKGNLIASNAEISGNISGDVIVQELLILRASSVVDGNIVAGKLMMENGAVFNGNVKMGTQVEMLKPSGEQSGRQIKEERLLAEA